MNDRHTLVQRILRTGLVAIVRARSAEQILPLTEALLEGGIECVEVTLTTPDALGAIRRASRHFGPSALIGVGTVLNGATAQEAIGAGAEYVVTPITRTEIVAAAHALDKPVMLGAYTPTEAQLAHEAGADFVKLFPADGLGPGYIKALRAPLPHLRIVPTGGVDLNTAADFLKAGCAALGVGSSLVSAKILQDSDWPELTRLARAFTNVVAASRAL
jgi:2-dehydro-3-deoxyphosphogluconate aldolase/(4S)-4-hydroxy-2-oxoglutarate aldolase